MKSLKECKDIIQNFANRFNLHFEEEGEVGFGMECVGLRVGDNYVDYNPTKYPDYNDIKEFYDERLYDIVPKDAYHKYACLAVLGRGDDAIRQLADWVEKLNELNATVVEYETGATGAQALATGTTNFTIKIR